MLGVFLSTGIDWGDIRAAAVGATTETQPAVLDLGIAIRGGAFDRTDAFTYAPHGRG